MHDNQIVQVVFTNPRDMTDPFKTIEVEGKDFFLTDQGVEMLAHNAGSLTKKFLPWKAVVEINYFKKEHDEEASGTRGINEPVINGPSNSGAQG